MVSAAEFPIRMGLRGKDGQWLSIIGGWRDADRAVICFQLNDDRGRPQVSLCTVIGGYLVENAISRNVRAIAFWAGASGQLAPNCRDVPAVCLHFDSNRLLWRALRRSLTAMAGLYPPRFRSAVEWIALPRSNSNENVRPSRHQTPVRQEPAMLSQPPRITQFHQWQANLRVLDVAEIKTVPRVPLSHPFVERLIGTLRRECLDHTLFWTSADLETKLHDFQNYYNSYRTHAGLGGRLPDPGVDGAPSPTDFRSYRWQPHCRGLYQTPIAA